MNISKYSANAQTLVVKSRETAKAAGHALVEPEHLLALLLQDKSIRAAITSSGGAVDRIANRMHAELSAYPKTASKTQVLSQRSVRLNNLAEQAANRGGSKRVELGHILIAFFDSDSAAGKAIKDSGIKKEKLEHYVKEHQPKRVELVAGKAAAIVQAASGEGSALANYTIDLTQKARDGKLGPVIGRTEEIRKIIQILVRHSKNNPALLGKPGVGRAATIDGLALRIASGDVPYQLRDKRVMMLDLPAMLAGTSLRGQFEERLKGLVNEIKADGNIILFIDDVHNLVGTGGEGASDAASMLKPALARGEIQILGSTTPEGYRAIEKDKALERRFQSIMIEEPSTAETISILRGIKNKFEIHHGVRVQDQALIEAVNLSKRYIQDRNLPDKAIDLVDEAAAKLKIEINSMPAVLDNCERAATHARMELKAIESDTNVDAAHKLALEKKIAELTEKAADIRSAWENEVSHIQVIRASKEELAIAEAELEVAEKMSDVDKATSIKYSIIATLKDKIASSTAELAKLGANRLIKEEVDPSDIATAIADKTGIPVSSMMESDIVKLANMEDRIGKRVIGQRESIEAIAKAIRRSRAGVNDPNRPVGSFFFLGPTGVGKTELAKALAQFLFDNETSLVRLDMSEFMEKHTISRLTGAPPGYKGAEEGGQLTEAVRLRPYCIVLLDEVEKAHPDIFNVLLQVLDDGRLTDGQGRLIDFRNVVVIMTSNIGSHFLLESTLESGSVSEEAKNKALEALRKHFRPEFLGRIDEVITFHGLTRENVEAIAGIQLNKIIKVMAEKKRNLVITDDAKKLLVNLGYEPAYGARPLRRAIQKHLLDPLAEQVLSPAFKGVDSIIINAKDDKLMFEAKKDNL